MVSVIAKGREYFVQLMATGKIQKIANDLQTSRQNYYLVIVSAFPEEQRRDVTAWLQYKWKCATPDQFPARVQKCLAKWARGVMRPLPEKYEKAYSQYLFKVVDDIVYLRGCVSEIQTLTAEGIKLREALFAFEPNEEQISNCRTAGRDFYGFWDYLMTHFAESRQQKLMFCEQDVKEALRQLPVGDLRNKIRETKARYIPWISEYLTAIEDLINLNRDPKYTHEIDEVRQALEKFKQDQNLRNFYNTCSKYAIEMSYQLPITDFAKFLKAHPCIQTYKYEKGPQRIFKEVVDEILKLHMLTQTKIIELCQEVLLERSR